LKEKIKPQTKQLENKNLKLEKQFGHQNPFFSKTLFEFFLFSIFVEKGNL
jgi:hypothetical protein